MNDRAAWIHHQSPTGFFSVEHPPDWKTERAENSLNIVPPWGTGAVTISAYFRGGTDPVPLEKLFGRTFDPADAQSDRIPIQSEKLVGFKQEFEIGEEGDASWWIAAIGEKGNVFALITANEAPATMDEHRSTYEVILNTLELHEQ
jgi:hypothetical protein